MSVPQESVPLELATLEQMIDELARRHTGVLVITMQLHQTANGSNETFNIGGRVATQTPLFTQIGMLSAAQHMITGATFGGIKNGA